MRWKAEVIDNPDTVGNRLTVVKIWGNHWSICVSLVVETEGVGLWRLEFQFQLFYLLFICFIFLKFSFHILIKVKIIPLFMAGIRIKLEGGLQIVKCLWTFYTEEASPWKQWLVLVSDNRVMKEAACRTCTYGCVGSKTTGGPIQSLIFLNWDIVHSIGNLLL